MGKQKPVPEESGKPRRSRSRLRRWLGRVVLCVFLLVLVGVLLGWLLLPRIAGRVIREKIVEAGMSGSELRVTDVGWRSAVIEDVSLGGGFWSVQVGRIEVDYDAIDLLQGEVESVRLVDSHVTVDLSPESLAAMAAEAAEEDGRQASGSPEPEKHWYKAVADALNQTGEIQAQDLRFTLKRGGEVWEDVVNLAIGQGAGGHPAVDIQASAFRLHADLVTFEDSAEWKCGAEVSQPEPFLSLVEMATGYDGKLLPEGMSLTGATLTYTFCAEREEVKPAEVMGLLENVRYDGGGKPVNLACKEDAQMALAVQASGSGEVRFSGELAKVSLPLDPSAGFELTLLPNNHPGFEVAISWGEQPTVVAGKVADMALAGKYNGRPVALHDVAMGFRMSEGDLSAEGKFSNGDYVMPVTYRHTMTGEDAGWIVDGHANIGPFRHGQLPPVVLAVSELFEDVGVAGTTSLRVRYSVGSHKPFRGTVTALLENGEVSVADGTVKASGVNGQYDLHILPLPDADPETKDPSYYSAVFTADKLAVASEESLGFDLCHSGEKPVTLHAKGKLGEEDAAVDIEVKGLALHGEKGGCTLDGDVTSMVCQLDGDELSADVRVVVGGNEIPVKYRHTRRDVGDDWEIDGSVRIPETKLADPLDNAAMFVDAMEGKTLGGKVSMTMDFKVGNNKDFDGTLAATVREGTLDFGDGGPVIGGLTGNIKLDPLKTKSTQGFHRVTARTVSAFDMDMKNLRLDYRILPNGDVMLKNAAVKALGGLLWLDPFTLPGGDDDYRFKIRAKRLDIAQVAKLFPDFDGSISGRIDGLLPMVSKGGKIRPGKGGMYLTPRTRGKLRYNAGNRFSAGLDPKTEEYKRMKMVEDSLRDLDLKVLSIRLFDPRDKDKAIVLKLRGQAHSVPGSPPIHLNINGFKPDDDTVDFFDLLLKHRDRLDFGL